MQLSRVLIRERNRKQAITRGESRDSPTAALRHYRPSFISKYCQLAQTFEVLEWLFISVSPTLENQLKQETQTSITNLQALIIAYMDAIEKIWENVPWIDKQGFKQQVLKKRLDKISKISIIPPMVDNT